MEVMKAKKIPRKSGEGATWYPRYYRAHSSRCFYTRNWHLYFFWKDSYIEQGSQSGITVKHRRVDKTWKHIMFRVQKTPSIAEAYKYGKLRVELSSHISTEVASGRVPLTKRYIRFGAAL